MINNKTIKIIIIIIIIIGTRWDVAENKWNLNTAWSLDSILN
jgi:hypothetical protein